MSARRQLRLALAAAASALIGGSAALAQAPQRPPSSIPPLPVPPVQRRVENPRAEIALGLKQTPVFAVLETYYPEAFKAAIDIVEQGMAKGRTMRDMGAEVRTTFLGVMLHELPKAEASSVHRGLILMRDEAQAASANPKACLVLLGFANFEFGAETVLPPELIAREQAWATEMLRQTATKPVIRTIKPPSKREQERVSIAAYDSLTSDDSRQRIARLGGRFQGVTDPDDQRAICEFALAFFGAIADKPPEEAANFFLGLSAPPTP